MKYALASFANLLTLAVGITIGIMLAPHFEKRVEAGAAPQAATAASPASAIPNPSNPEQVQPGITVGSLGASLLLAHHIQSDELVVNGIDLLKLHQGELNLLSKSIGVTPSDIQNVVNDARNTHLYQVASPKPPTPAPTPNKN